jgi:S-formylglutathione hydrolase FrmB
LVVRPLTVALLLVGLVTWPGTAQAESRATSAGTATGTGIAVVDDQVVDGDVRLHELTLQSGALGRTAKIRILLPAGYDEAANAASRYPLVLLLHGVGDDQSSWTNNTDIAAFTAAAPLIIVMPEAGHTPDSGWYSDWVDGPAWETFHIRELLPWVDATYRTVGTRAARAIAGFSMGGFGSMSYAARHPELFVAAAEFSGAVDTTVGGQGEAALLALLQPSAGTPSSKVWGPYETDEARWRTHNPVDLASNLRWTDLWLVSGNGVPVPGDKPQTAPLEAGVYVMNLTFHQRLVDLGVAHAWHDRGHGTHDWPYRQLDFHTWLPVLLDVLAAPPPAPSTFAYRSAEPSFSAWDWSFTTDRPGLQFVELQDVSAAGLTATGSGPLGVTTAPVYAPGSTQHITGDDGGKVDVVVDGDGRLRFTIDLGPGQAEPPSPVLGVSVTALAADHRVTRAVSITAVDGVTSTTGATGAVLSSAPGGEQLPVTGGESSTVWVGAALLAATAAARWCRARALIRAR